TLCRGGQHGGNSRPAACGMAIVYFALADDREQGHVAGLAGDRQRGLVLGCRLRLLGGRILSAQASDWILKEFALGSTTAGASSFPNCRFCGNLFPLSPC